MLKWIAAAFRAFGRACQNNPFFAAISFVLGVVGFFAAPVGQLWDAIVPFDQLQYIEGRTQHAGNVYLGQTLVVDLTADWSATPLTDDVSERTICQIQSEIPAFVTLVQENRCVLRFEIKAATVDRSSGASLPIGEKKQATLDVRVCIWGLDRRCTHQKIEMLFLNDVKPGAFKLTRSRDMVPVGSSFKVEGRLFDQPLPEGYTCTSDAGAPMTSLVELSHIGACTFLFKRIRDSHDFTQVFLLDSDGRTLSQPTVFGPESR